MRKPARPGGDTTQQGSTVSGDTPRESGDRSEPGDPVLEALERERRHLATIVDQIHDSVISTDLDGTVTSWNDGAMRLFGYSAGEMIGKSIDLVYSEDERDFLEQQVIAPLKRNGSHEVEVRMRRRSGEGFCAHLSLSMLRDDSGADVGMIGYAMDITERRLAEDALKARARQQAAVAELGWYALAGGARRLEEVAVGLIARTLGVEHCELLELSPEGRSLVLEAGVGWQDGYVGHTVIPAGADSMAGYTLQAGGAVVVEDLPSEPRFRGPQLLVDHGVVSGLSVIVPGRERPYGVLGAHSTKRRSFTEDDVNFLRAMANVLAEAIARKRAEQALERSRARLRSLSERLVDAQEQERRTIAHELHDEIGQSLSAAKIQLHLARGAGSLTSATPFLNECTAILEHALLQVRDLSLDLRPSVLDERGLPEALAWFIQRQKQRLNLDVELVFGPVVSGRPDRTVETACFRIVQEALTNAARHAVAAKVRVELSQDDAGLLLRIQDDGVGFEVASALGKATGGESLGLLGMQERAASLGGTLTIHSAPGGGTRIEARLPSHPMPTTDQPDQTVV